MTADGKIHSPAAGGSTLCGLRSFDNPVTAFRFKVSCPQCQQILIGKGLGVDFLVRESGLTEAEQGVPA